MDKKREYAELKPETVSFPSRLKDLIEHNSVRSFSQKVDLSETEVRKYLNGALPALLASVQRARIIASVYCHAETTNLKPEELTEELVKMAIDVVRD